MVFKMYHGVVYELYCVNGMDKKKIGEIIRGRRKLLGIAQEDLCELATISQHTLSAVENGTANPTLDTLLKLCDILGLDLTPTVRRLS